MTPAVAVASQRKEALRLANVNRLARLDLLARLKTGEACAVQVLTDLPEFMESLPVHEFLLHLPRVGRYRLARFNAVALRDGNVNLLRELGELTARQREWLLTEGLRKLRHP